MSKKYGKLVIVICKLSAIISGYCRKFGGYTQKNIINRIKFRLYPKAYSNLRYNNRRNLNKNPVI